MTPDLHDIVLPEPVSLMPQTPAWWVALGLVVVALAWAALTAARRYRADRYRRLALARLAEIERDLPAPAALARLPILVKQTALACRPRAEVAALSGEPWLRFLDESVGGEAFTRGPGRLLPALAYARPGEVSASELRELTRLVRRWIRRHAGSAGVSPAREGERVRV